MRQVRRETGGERFAGPAGMPPDVPDTKEYVLFAFRSKVSSQINALIITRQVDK